MANAGDEVRAHVRQLRLLIRQIMMEHTLRKGCGWRPGAEDRVLDGLVELIEAQERCREDA